MKTIQLKDEVVVSDPCYELGTWCAARLKGVKPGTYYVFVKKTDEGSWGVRVANLMVVHEDHVKGILKWEQLPHDIGVDSGQCGIFSLESFRNDDHNIPPTESEFSKKYVKWKESGEKWYVSMCDFTLSDTQWGFYDQGVVSSSGLGDGSYVLFGAKNSDGEIVALSVDYLLGNEISGDDDEEDTHISIDLDYYHGQHLINFLNGRKQKNQAEI